MVVDLSIIGVERGLTEVRRLLTIGKPNDAESLLDQCFARISDLLRAPRVPAIEPGATEVNQQRATIRAQARRLQSQAAAIAAEIEP